MDCVSFFVVMVYHFFRFWFLWPFAWGNEEDLQSASVPFTETVVVLAVIWGLSRPDDLDHRSRPSSVKPFHDVSMARGLPTDFPRFRSRSPLPPPRQVDIYQHPDKWTNPSNRYRHGYDIYSFGVVLVEIDLWKNLKGLKLAPGYNAEDYRKYLLTNLVPTLNGQCGSIYAAVVRECLTMACEIADMERQSQRAERLDKCIV